MEDLIFREMIGFLNSSKTKISLVTAAFPTMFGRVLRRKKFVEYLNSRLLKLRWNGIIVIVLYASGVLMKFGDGLLTSPDS